MRYSSVLYAGLLIARVLFSVLPAYIHPDEFFQSSEIAASDILQVAGLRTWEFSPLAPVRSIVPIYMYAGSPMLVLSFLPLTPRTLFYSSRVFMALLSFVVDLCVFQIVGKKRRTMVLLASSYCLAVFHVHTFANAFASVVLAACFWLLAEIEAGERRLFALGAALALGSFTHIAFPMFAWPLGAASLAMLVSATRSGRLTYGGLAWALLRLAAGGILTVLAMVVGDSLYYGSLKWQGFRYPFVSGSLTFTVVNNVAYNSQHNNLAAHGIQPRYLHALVNMPLLFGPLYLLAIVRLWAFLRAGSGASYVSMAAAASVLSGVALLSAAPHQEARFLLPALPGLAISTRRWLPRAPRYFWWAWIVFNVALFAVFSVHQAGVVPVVAHLGESVWPHAQCRAMGADALCSRGASAGVQLTTRAYFVSAYMAPRHLLAQRADAMARVEVVDLVGMEMGEIRDVIAGSIHVNETLVRESPGELVFRQTASARYERTLVVVPGSVDLERIAPLSANYRLVRVFSYAPHVNFDHMAETLRSPVQSSRLSVYAVCGVPNVNTP
ncbi:alpha 1,2 mannosyltransferase, partial [Coemansia sp. 'formosensis']